MALEAIQSVTQAESRAREAREAAAARNRQRLADAQRQARQSAEEARAFFDRAVHDVSAHLHHLDSHCEELDAVGRLRVLHDFYRPGEEKERS